MEETPFINEPIQLDKLPRQSDLQFEPLHANYLKANVITTIVIGTIICSILAVLSLFWSELSSNIYIVISIVVLIFLLILVLEVLGFKHKGYALRQKDITYKTGFIFRTVTSLPFNRVQHCEVNQGPIDRAVGLSGIKIFTAGGSNSDLEIPGLETSTANRIKHIIVKKTSLDEEE